MEEERWEGRKRGREERGGGESVMPVNRCRFHQHLSPVMHLSLTAHTSTYRKQTPLKLPFIRVCVHELLVFDGMYKWKGSENENRKG